MDHSLFGCLRSPHTSAPDLLAAVTPLPRHSHSKLSAGRGFQEVEDDDVLHDAAQQVHVPQQSSSWLISQQIPSPGARNGIDLPPLENIASELCPGDGNLCRTEPGGELSGTSCEEYSQKSLSSDETDAMTPKGKKECFSTLEC